MKQTDIYLITGASGFIGQHLIDELTKRKATIITLPHENLSNTPKLAEFVFEQQPDYIIHLAAYGNMAAQRDIAKTIASNYMLTLNLLTALNGIDYKKFVFVSSSSVNLRHETFYSASKAGAERLCQAFRDEFDKPISIFRPYSVYGEGEVDNGFIPIVFHSCLTGKAMNLSPKPVHDWIYIEDVVRDILKLCHLNIDIFESGTGVQTSNEAVVEMIERITKKQANILEHKQLRSFDTTQWRQTINYNNYTYTKLEDGLEKIYPWYKKKYAQ